MFIINKITSIGVIGAICGVSIVINILALPLYNIADSIQEKERQINKKMEYRVKRIKKAFKGDEQFMMLSEYYRQNNYHPLYALRGSLSILIEIPFFIAAYNYLSSSEILKESSFWIFSNLGEPDRMLDFSLGSITIPINILPIIMTLINFISGYIYTKDATTRDKVQLYALGLFFLVLLYNSPSGLVIYWILNNIFSLVKTIVLKTKHPGRFLHAFISLGLIAFAFYFRDASERSRFYFASLFAAIFTISPLLISMFKKANFLALKGGDSTSSKVLSKPQNYLPLLLTFGIALAFLCGFLLPSSTIATSPEEFSFLGSIENPSSYVWSTLWFYVGLFVFWPFVVYKMFSDKVKKNETAILFTVLVVALVNVFIYKGNYGTITNQFYLSDANALDEISLAYKVFPLLWGALALLAFYIIDYFGKTTIISLLSISLIIGEIGISSFKLNSINKSFTNYKKLIEENKAELLDENQIQPVFNLSKDGKNVVVVFLDRALGIFLPYAIEEVPELKEQFRGFIDYRNTASFSGNTTHASPSMMGGYEYTTLKMNERPGLLKDLHNEATLVLPTLFKNANYSVTVTDPPFPNYSWREDLSAIKEIGGVNAQNLYGKYTRLYFNEVGIKTEEKDKSLTTKKEAINFSFLQILPPFLRYTFEVSCRDVNNQDFKDYINSFSSLYFLDELTDFTNERNTYSFIGNDSTHQPVLLDSTLLKSGTKTDRFISNYPTNDDATYKHYSVFVAVLRAIGNWLDYLRANDVYDNTIIIIVSDHGFYLDTPDISHLAAQCNPLFLYKDFNSNGELTFSDEFMTNADTLFLATESLDDISKINPFTGNEFKQEKENGIEIYFTPNGEWNAPDLVDRTEFTLDKNDAWHVEKNIFDESNWTPLIKWEEENK